MIKTAVEFSLFTRIKDPADHAREHHEEHGQQFQVTTQDTSSLNVSQISGGQTALNDDLHHTHTHTREKHQIFILIHYTGFK